MKNFDTIKEIKFADIKELDGFTVTENNCTVTIEDVDARGVFTWKATSDLGEMNYKTNLYYMKKRLSGEIKSTSESKTKATRTTLHGTTKRLVAQGKRILSDDELRNNACNMLDDYYNALSLVNKIRPIIEQYPEYNDTINAIFMLLKDEQEKEIEKIRRNERAKTLFARRIEIANEHLAKLEREVVRLAMNDKFDEIPALKQAVNEQTEFIANLERQKEQFK